MDRSGELSLLCSTLKRIGVNVSVATPSASLKSFFGSGMSILYAADYNINKSIEQFTGECQPNTLYRLTDNYRLSYIFFLLNDEEPQELFFMGPYLSSEAVFEDITKLHKNDKILPSRAKMLEKFFTNIPVIKNNSPLLLLIDIFCENIWGNTSFSVVDINKEETMPASPINQINENETLEDIKLNMELMEKRYRFENDLIEAVKHGQINKASSLFSALTDFSFERRTEDPIRNMKNYCIIMNTLLRKAAESGGVHPIYIDSVSTDFAVRIEKLSLMSDIGNLMLEMFRSYCRLVRKHTMKNYSKLVQNTVIYIESDLSANLTLSSLSEAQKVSSGYLSAIFRRETGMTVTEYIRKKRIKHAMHLLGTTNLQIQTVALNCGIMDMQYFSKLFRRETGMTANEYRENAKNRQ